jgi:hypothetical protein
VVSRAAPPRPGWSRLYLALALVAAATGTARVLAAGTALAPLADAALGLCLFGTLFGWVRLNRLALARGDEPEAGVGRPRARAVRSSARPADEAYVDEGVVRLAPQERVVLPYDFR